jgi:hypothetical protein
MKKIQRISQVLIFLILCAGLLCSAALAYGVALARVQQYGGWMGLDATQLMIRTGSLDVYAVVEGIDPPIFQPDVSWNS